MWALSKLGIKLNTYEGDFSLNILSFHWIYCNIPYCASYCQECILLNRFQVYNEQRLLRKVLYIVRRDDLGKICWNLCKTTIILLIFLVIPFICSEKFNFIYNAKPRCFWKKLLVNGILLNKRVGWSNSLVFLLNITSCAFLLKSRLKIIFHWKAQLVIAFRSWLK